MVMFTSKILLGRNRLFFPGLLLFSLMFIGCARSSSHFIEPITPSQRDFYEIRTLHEKGRSRELLVKAQSFLSAYPQDELARPVRYYTAFHSNLLGQRDVARKYYQELVTLYPSSGWAQLAESSLKSMDQ